MASLSSFNINMFQDVSMRGLAPKLASCGIRWHHVASYKHDMAGGFQGQVHAPWQISTTLETCTTEKKQLLQRLNLFLSRSGATIMELPGAPKNTYAFMWLGAQAITDIN